MSTAMAPAAPSGRICEKQATCVAANVTTAKQFNKGDNGAIIRELHERTNVTASPIFLVINLCRSILLCKYCNSDMIRRLHDTSV